MSHVASETFELKEMENLPFEQAAQCFLMGKILNALVFLSAYAILLPWIFFHPISLEFIDIFFRVLCHITFCVLEIQI